MAVPHEIQYKTFAARRAALGDDRGEARTKTLGALVAVMVVAGVVALIMTVFSNDSNNSQAATQPAGSQVGRATTSVPSAGASSGTLATPASTTPATSTPAISKPSTSTPATASTSGTAKPARTSASTGTSSKVVKYTVRKGDNLTLIAKWFSQRGVTPVYDWNKSVIGKNPNLIYPGQTIIVSLNGDKMNVTTKNK